MLRIYEHSLGLAFVALFLISWCGHALGGFAAFAEDAQAHRGAAPTLGDYLSSSRFRFESFQNWQSPAAAGARAIHRIPL